MSKVVGTRETFTSNGDKNDDVNSSTRPVKMKTDDNDESSDSLALDTETETEVATPTRTKKVAPRSQTPTKTKTGKMKTKIEPSKSKVQKRQGDESTQQKGDEEGAVIEEKVSKKKTASKRTIKDERELERKEKKLERQEERLQQEKEGDRGAQKEVKEKEGDEKEYKTTAKIEEDSSKHKVTEAGKGKDQKSQQELHHIVAVFKRDGWGHSAVVERETYKEILPFKQTNIEEAERMEWKSHPTPLLSEEALQEKGLLAEVFIHNIAAKVDPDSYTRRGKSAHYVQLSKTEDGDRYWSHREPIQRSAETAVKELLDRKTEEYDKQLKTVARKQAKQPSLRVTRSMSRNPRTATHQIPRASQSATSARERVKRTDDIDEQTEKMRPDYSESNRLEAEAKILRKEADRSAREANAKISGSGRSKKARMKEQDAKHRSIASVSDVDRDTDSDTNSDISSASERDRLSQPRRASKTASKSRLGRIRT